MRSLFSRSTAKLSNKRLYVDFAKKHKALYLGTVGSRRKNSKNDELIRGFTFSHKVHDLHHCIGEYEGYEYTLVDRKTPGGDIIIASVDLHAPNASNSAIILPNLLPEELFASLMRKFSAYRHLPYHQHDEYSAVFKDTYSTLCLPTYFQTVSAYLQGETAALIEKTEARFLIEIDESHVYVYNLRSNTISEASLWRQVKFASKLASLIEQKITP